MQLHEHPHKRFNPLTGEWVLVSPHRTKRPWQGQSEDIQRTTGPGYDPDCYLCPGNSRAGGVKNPLYSETFVFDNDFSALLPDTPAQSGEWGPNDMFRARQVRGLCRVVCFSPRHDLTLARMDTAAVKAVIEVWADQYEELSALDFIHHIQIFENRGAVMGCSNPHPHGQIWAEDSLPDLPAREMSHQQEYFRKHGSTLLLDYLAHEQAERERIVYANDSWTVLVPFWAVWPYEVMILPNRAVQSLPELRDHERVALAEAMRHLGIKYDNLFTTSFPYSMGIHQLPTDGREYDGFQMHMHYFPPLLRSATVKKFMVGYEMLAGPQRDITAEMSAGQLRELPAIHYRDTTEGF